MAGLRAGLFISYQLVRQPKPAASLLIEKRAISSAKKAAEDVQLRLNF